jgi:hypothetical protein
MFRENWRLVNPRMALANRGGSSNVARGPIHRGAPLYHYPRGRPLMEVFGDVSALVAVGEFQDNPFRPRPPSVDGPARSSRSLRCGGGSDTWRRCDLRSASILRRSHGT